jgi:hypothetical protein
MKKILLFLAIFSILMFITVGCKSDPEPTPTETPVEEVPPVEQDRIIAEHSNFEDEE